MLEIVDPAGNKRAFESALNISKNTRQGIRQAWFRIGKDLISTFNQQVLDKAKKTGTVYRFRDRGGSLRRHKSSAAGESPANRKGTYRRSAGYRISGVTQLAFGASAPHAGFLEGGTSRMKARPGLGNAIRANERNILREFSENIQEAL